MLSKNIMLAEALVIRVLEKARGLTPEQVTDLKRAVNHIARESGAQLPYPEAG
jgi:hypothetical protein